jgi:hypothetical protein
MQQAILGTKIPFRRTPKISGRTRTPALYLVLEIAMMLLSTGLAFYYLSQLRWISGTFALANAGLVLYGIWRFVGFSEMKEDLVHGWHEFLGRYNLLWTLQSVKERVRRGSRNRLTDIYVGPTDRDGQVLYLGDHVGDDCRVE